jgi:hypothetical protein
MTTVEGKQQLKTGFLNFKLSYPAQRYFANIIGAACNSQIRLPHAILFYFSGFLGFCMRYNTVSNPFLQAAKRNLILFRAETKGGK